MNILHSTTDPSLLQRLKEMLSSSARADMAVGYFFVSGFEQVSAELGALKKVRILVGRTDRQVALGANGRRSAGGLSGGSGAGEGPAGQARSV